MILLKAQPLLTGGCPETRERHRSSSREKGGREEKKRELSQERELERRRSEQGPRVSHQ